MGIDKKRSIVLLSILLLSGCSLFSDNSEPSSADVAIDSTENDSQANLEDDQETSEEKEEALENQEELVEEVEEKSEEDLAREEWDNLDQAVQFIILTLEIDNRFELDELTTSAVEVYYSVDDDYLFTHITNNVGSDPYYRLYDEGDKIVLSPDAYLPSGLGKAEHFEVEPTDLAIVDLVDTYNEDSDKFEQASANAHEGNMTNDNFESILAATLPNNEGLELYDVLGTYESTQQSNGETLHISEFNMRNYIDEMFIIDQELNDGYLNLLAYSGPREALSSIVSEYSLPIYQVDGTIELEHFGETFRKVADYDPSSVEYNQVSDYYNYDDNYHYDQRSDQAVGVHNPYKPSIISDSTLAEQYLLEAAELNGENIGDVRLIDEGNLEDIEDVYLYQFETTDGAIFNVSEYGTITEGLPGFQFSPQWEMP